MVAINSLGEFMNKRVNEFIYSFEINGLLNV